MARTNNHRKYRGVTQGVPVGQPAFLGYEYEYTFCGFNLEKKRFSGFTILLSTGEGKHAILTATGTG